MPYKDPEKQKEAQARNYRANKVKWLRRSRKRRNELKEWFNAEIMSGLSCTRCGESHSACLDFHHKEPTVKSFSIRDMVNQLRNRDWIVEEIQKCIILCSNCHRKLHHDVRKAMGVNCGRESDT